MLQNLPTEAIISIVRHLDLDDKFSLIATCKSLNEVISKTNMYEYLNLNLYERDIGELLKVFEEKPYKGRQVKRLCLTMDIIPKSTIPRLSKIFPNVTVLSTDDDKIYGSFCRYPTPEPLATWKNTLEKYNSSYSWFPIWRALENNKFPRLTELEIEEEEDDDCEIHVGGFDPLYFVPHIQNAPALKKLAIRKSDVNLQFLEVLHASCPHLQSLTLKETMFQIDADTLPEHIVPAEPVVYLEINNVMCFDRNGLFLEYILKKYPNLRYLSFVVEHSDKAAADKLNMYYPGSENYFTNNDAYFDVDEDYYDLGYHCPVGIEKNAYQKLISSFRTAVDTYRSTASKFFSSLPKTIKNLKVNVELFTNIVQILAESDMKLTKLSIESSGSLTTRLEESDQLVYLKRMASLKTMVLTLNPSEQILDPGFVSTSITRLTINLKGDSLHIDWLLAAFPSVVDLNIQTSNYLRTSTSKYKSLLLGGRNKKSSRKIYPALRKVRLHCVRVHQHVFDFIKVAAPNVKELDLEIGSITDSTTKVTAHNFDLSGWKLNRCHIRVYNSDDQFSDRDCKVTIDNTYRRFILDSHGDKIIFSGDNYFNRSSEKLTQLNLKCDAIKNFKLYGLRLKKVGNQVMAVAK